MSFEVTVRYCNRAGHVKQVSKQYDDLVKADEVLCLVGERGFILANTDIDKTVKSRYILPHMIYELTVAEGESSEWTASDILHVSDKFEPLFEW